MNKFAKNFFSLFSGNIAAQLVSFAAIPFITRIYSPYDFGVFTLMSSMAAVLFPICCLNYENAILVEKDKDRSDKILLLCFMLLGGACISAQLIIYPTKSYISQVFNNPKLEQYIFIVPCWLFFKKGSALLSAWNLRAKSFIRISSARIVHNSTAALTKLGAGFYCGPIPGWLALGELLGGALACLIHIARRMPEFFSVIKGTSFRDLREAAVSNKSFALYGTPSKLLAFAAQEFLPFFISAVFSPVAVGYYGAATRVIQRPLNTLAMSLNSAYFQKGTSQVAANRPVYPSLKKLVLVLALGGAIPAIVFSFFAPEIFAFVLGSKWVIAGEYAQIMIPWAFILFVKGPTNYIYEMFKKQRIRLKLNVVSALLRVASLLGGYYYMKTPYGTLGVYVATYFITDLIILLTAMRIAKEADKRLLSR